MSGRWRHPNRTQQRQTSIRPRRYKPEDRRLKHIRENLDDYRAAARYICELVARIEI